MVLIIPAANRKREGTNPAEVNRCSWKGYGVGATQTSDRHFCRQCEDRM
ncbi:hypothetical protein RMSM_04862 [Rhodopirellula maiorica SM1]|uniref:Uncharacterized protein n=1 Tax=Rhodopirellula maiorica SM1 TaxID=1265738 RepID=M5RW83_9BACT|nr:hypothetical protein RMSM_04862 [Rhodopirellula maiorica SM1]